MYKTNNTIKSVKTESKYVCFVFRLVSLSNTHTHENPLVLKVEAVNKS